MLWFEEHILHGVVADSLRLNPLHEADSEAFRQVHERVDVFPVGVLARHARRNRCQVPLVEGVLDRRDGISERPLYSAELIVRQWVVMVDAHHHAMRSSAAQFSGIGCGKIESRGQDPKLRLRFVAPDGFRHLAHPEHRFTTCKSDVRRPHRLQILNHAVDVFGADDLFLVEVVPLEAMLAFERAFLGHRQKHHRQLMAASAMGHKAVQLPFQERNVQG